MAGRRPVGVFVEVRSGVVWIVPLNGSERDGEVRKEKPQKTLRAPSDLASAPGYIRCSEAAPVAAA